MSPEKKRVVLLVPPDGSRVTQVAIRRGLIVLLLVVLPVGLLSFFIPFDRLTLTEEEENYKKNLSEQNKKLSRKLYATLKDYSTLQENLERIEGKQQQLSAMESVPVPQAGGQPAPDSRWMENGNVESVLLFASENERFIREVAHAVAKKPSLLGSIPVCVPVKDSFTVSAGFGKRKDPFTQEIKWHYGVDFVAGSGTPVYATADGVIILIERHKRWGRRIAVRHAHGFKTFYAHLDRAYGYRGKRVKRGQCIGTVGTTGLTIGPHLHYEVWHDEKPVDPAHFFFPEVDSSFSVAGALDRSDR